MGNTNDSDDPEEESLSDVLRAAVAGQCLESPASGKVTGTVSSRSSCGGSGHSQDNASDGRKPSQSCSSQGNDAGSDASRIKRRGRVRHTSSSNGGGGGGGGSGGGGSRSDGRDSAKGDVEVEDRLRARKTNRTSKADGAAPNEIRVRSGVATRGSSGDSHTVVAEGGKKRQASKFDNSRGTSTGGEATKAGNVLAGRLSISVMSAPLKVMIGTGQLVQVLMLTKQISPPHGTRPVSATSAASIKYLNTTKDRWYFFFP